MSLPLNSEIFQIIVQFEDRNMDLVMNHSGTIKSLEMIKYTNIPV